MSRGALTPHSVFGIASIASLKLARKLGVFAVALGCLGSSAKAADLTWGGTYRVEAVKIEGSELGGTTSDKAYFLHHLTLTPKIIAADGLTIYSRFDLFNNPTWGANQQLGEFLGRGVNNSIPQSTTTRNESDSNVLSRSGKAGDLAVTTLYASWVQEFGQLVVGRAPVQFGLGLSFNAGNGMFDHYIDTRDLVGYKVVLGNFFFMPMLAKVNEGNLGEEDDVNDYIFHLQYDNPETELALGLLYDIRVSTFAGNDIPSGANAGTNIGGTNPIVADGGKSTLIGLYASQKVSNFTIAVEADMLSGDTGLKSAAGAGVSLNSFGIAGDITWAPPESKTKGGLKIGMATGDDPGTTDVYEGFAFSRNYDVAMLMFNHPLGQADFLRTGLVRNTTIKASNQPDTEAISNVIYIAPNLQQQWKENLSWGGTLVYGMLNKNPLPGTDTATSLGFELDLNLTYKPYDRLTWVTEAGFLFPGEAWKGGTSGFENKFAYGLITKAAISF
jgi:hypothetical protein